MRGDRPMSGNPRGNRQREYAVGQVSVRPGGGRNLA